MGGRWAGRCVAPAICELLGRRRHLHLRLRRDSRVSSECTRDGGLRGARETCKIATRCRTLNKGIAVPVADIRHHRACLTFAALALLMHNLDNRSFESYQSV